MPTNKKHHYVPRFHLKNFSSDGKLINLYNIASDKVIIGGNLKNQCYKDYFYGKEKRTEKALGVLEGAAAVVLKKIIGSGSLPSQYTDEYKLLLI